MELEQALIRMEQGGSADGVLQVRADRIRSNLEGLMKALSDRCKKHNVEIKSAAVIELPIGWHPGVPEISSVWDENWDKFEDEGFDSDVLAWTKSKSTDVEQEKYSENRGFAPDLMSHDDATSENPDSNGEHVFGSEDETGKSPSESRVGRAFESPSGEHSDNHFKRSPEAYEETHGGLMTKAGVLLTMMTWIQCGVLMLVIQRSRIVRNMEKSNFLVLASTGIALEEQIPLEERANFSREGHLLTLYLILHFQGPITPHQDMAWEHREDLLTTHQGSTLSV